MSPVPEGHSVKLIKPQVKLTVRHHVILIMEDVLIMKCAPYNNKPVQTVPGPLVVQCSSELIFVSITNSF